MSHYAYTLSNVYVTNRTTCDAIQDTALCRHKDIESDGQIKFSSNKAKKLVREQMYDCCIYLLLLLFFFVNGKQCKKNMDYQQSVVSVVLIKNASSFGCTG